MPTVTWQDIGKLQKMVRTPFFFFIVAVETGPIMPFRLELSNKKVYEP
jgi:hypothetical protein